MSTGKAVLAPHHSAVARFASESEAMAYLVARNAADERSARLGSVNPRNSKRYVAYSTASYADVMAVHKERDAINQLVATIQAMATTAA